jgi:integrase
MQSNNLGQREYADIIAAAQVKPIKFHGLRHTCATLSLLAKGPVHVVSERLGHRSIKTTMDIYAHVLPDMEGTRRRHAVGRPASAEGHDRTARVTHVTT